MNINTQLLHILALTRIERVTSDIDRQNVTNTIQDMSPLQHDPAPGAKVIQSQSAFNTLTWLKQKRKNLSQALIGAVAGSSPVICLLLNNFIETMI